MMKLLPVPLEGEAGELKNDIQEDYASKAIPLLKEMMMADIQQDCMMIKFVLKNYHRCYVTQNKTGHMF